MSKQDERMAKVRAEYEKLERVLLDPTAEPFLKKLARYAYPKVTKRYMRMMRARKQLFKQLEERDGE
jgi:hypothetical protein